MALRIFRGHNFHPLPAIGKLAAAIDANNIRTCLRSGTRPTLTSLHSVWKSEIPVPASKQQVK